jgi:hypothetical protein
MTTYRNDVPWNVSQGGSTPIEGLPGVYNSTNVTAVSTMVAAVKAAGLKNLLVVTVNQNPGMCPTLSTALASGTLYSSINVGSATYPCTFAISIGDSIQLTSGPGGSTQTVVAAANMAAGAYGALTVTAFTANANYGVGAWIYDTVWVACTPQHFSDMMVHLVSQSGLQGLDWELFNEPDGGSWGIPVLELYQAYSLAYPAMKAADPTCTVHGLALSSTSSPPTYYNAFIALGGLAYYDALSVHQYWLNATSPMAPNAPYIYSNPFITIATQLGAFQANRVSLGDNKPLWWTEVGWPFGSGGCTPALQSQWLQDLFVILCGNDPVNGGLYSSYLKAVLIYAMIQDGTYALAPTGIANPAVAVLTELVSGH